MRRAFPLAVLVLLCAQSAFAQVDLMGVWRPLPRNQDGSGMTGDVAGVPVSDAARWRLQSWSPEDFDVTEWACRPHAWDYSLEGPLSALRIWADIDQDTQKVITYHGHLNQQEQETTIWMDGRPRPPANALHTWSGFSTGEWDGDVLVESITHLKENYIRRWGPMRSDDATVRIRYKRIGTNYLRATVIIYDPVYMTEPYVRTALMWVLDPNLVLPPYPCEEATDSVVAHGDVPHYLPGKNLLPAQNPKEDDQFGTPYAARLGGAETMYPEYIKKLGPFPRTNMKKEPAAERGQ